MASFTAINTARIPCLSSNAGISGSTNNNNNNNNNNNSSDQFDPMLEPWVLDCLKRVKEYFGEETEQANVERAVAACALVDMKAGTANHDGMGTTEATTSQSSSSASTITRLGKRKRSSSEDHARNEVDFQVLTPTTPTPSPELKNMDDDDDDDDDDEYDGNHKAFPLAKSARPSSASKAKSTKGKRNRYDPDNNDKIRSDSDKFAHQFKKVMNARSNRNDDYERFSDAQLPGASQSLQAEETALCDDLNIPLNVYRCQRARFFLGIAAFTEEIRRRRAKGLLTKAPWNIGKAQFQLFGNMDSNKSSKVFDKFLKLGWVQESKQTATSLLTYERMFSQEHRDDLHEEMRLWEVAHVPLEDDRLVTVL
ncbi:hypothetical protein RBB50_009648 [Rhinocladiella similis]